MAHGWIINHGARTVVCGRQSTSVWCELGVVEMVVADRGVGVGTLLGFEETTGLFSWCCPCWSGMCVPGWCGVGVLFENCIVDASIFVAFKNFSGFCVSF